MKKHLVSHICIWLSVLLLAVVGFVPVLAAGGQAQLAVYCNTEGHPVAQVRIDLYRIGDIANDTLLPGTPYNTLVLPALQTSSAQTAFAVAAETLQAYIVKNDIQPTATTVTDAEGKAQFVALDSGVYLVLADFSRTKDMKTAAALPALVFVSEKQADTPPVPGIYLKIDKHPETPTEPTNPTNPTTPTEPTAPTEPTVPTGPTTPTEPTSPTVPTEPTTPTNPTKPTKPTTPTQPGETTELTTKKPPKEEIPRTGQLWWPVPVLAAAAFVCFGCGVAAYKKKQEKEQ